MNRRIQPVLILFREDPGVYPDEDQDLVVGEVHWLWLLRSQPPTRLSAGLYTIR